VSKTNDNPDIDINNQLTTMKQEIDNLKEIIEKQQTRIAFLESKVLV
jgi:hypothetical protein